MQRIEDMKTPTLVAMDFETAGYYKYSACAIGLAKISGPRIIDEYYSLIRPPSSRVCFTHIHGLTWDDLKKERTFEEVWKDVLGFITNADFIIAHNAPFDRSVMRGCCEAFGLLALPQPFLCTLKGSRKALKIPSKSLDKVCAYFNIPLNHHHAGSDAIACGQIYMELHKLGVSDQQMQLT